MVPLFFFNLVVNEYVTCALGCTRNAREMDSVLQEVSVQDTLWIQYNEVGQFLLLVVPMMIFLLVGLMMIDMNGPDIEGVDEVKVVILEPVNVWKNYKNRYRQG